MIEIVVHASADAFLEAAEPTLMADEARNSLLLGLAHALHSGRTYGDEEPLLLTLRRGERVVGAALQTPPWQLVLSPVDPPACDALVDWLVAQDTAVSGVNGVNEVARRFAERYTARVGLHAEVMVRTRLFELLEVVDPPAPGGHMRRATGDDRELVTAWYAAFHAEATRDAPQGPGPDFHLDAGKIWLWIDAAGVPVSLAGRNREQPTGACIGPVYTPPEHRGRGYATALVAALSRSILDDGKRYACLFTDLANPTSNAIYPRVGYRPIADMTVWTFRDERV